MKKLALVFYLLCFVVNAKAYDSIPDIKSAFSDQYSLKYFVNENFYDNDSLIPKTKISGLVQRSNGVLFSKSETVVGIFKDTCVFLLDSELKDIIIGTRKNIRAFLLTPFYDPFEIVSFATENKASITKTIKGTNVIYRFVFSYSVELPVYEISISFDSNYLSINSPFQIKLIFQRGTKIMDIINYAPTSKFSIKKIEDFLDIENGKFVPKKEYQNYLFTNWLGL